SVQSILNLNPGVNPQNLQIGSTICIPTASTAPIVPAPLKPAALPTKTSPSTMTVPPVTCPKGSFSYTIQAGDTLWKLSQIYGVSVQSIFDLNPGINPQNLQIGSTICIPTASTAPIVPTVPAPLIPTVPPISPAPMMPTVPPTKAAPMMPTAPSTMKVPPVTCAKGSFSYTIQAGDTLWQLSQIYGVSVQSILDLNPGINPQNLQIGSIICIPTTPATPIVPIRPAVPAPLIPTVPPTTVSSPRNFEYLIKKCDTICGIARKFYVSVESILRENPQINPRCLRAGMCIYVPINCCGENTWRYTVRAGDTLHRIANKLNVCPSAIIAANPNIDFRHLIHCQVICIPKE
ncbi:MAG TPA: LysM peptidoglycan-binding domain-containing protein, partial [Ruminiclostridium sp.]|nr:LysM peptidoglycan-binding domain-containing protein [Ruminiclostridium sp.]